MDFSPPRTPISANGAVSGPWRRRPPPTASPLAAAAEKGRLYREYEALKTARTLTADDVAKCWANGAALTALAILYVALKIYGILQFLNYLIAILAAIFILNLVPSFIKAEFGAVDLPDFQTWAAAKRAAPTNRAAAARASGAMPSTPAKSSSSPRTAPGTPMDLDKASPTRARADSFGSAAGSQPNASVSSEPLVSPISPLVNYVLRLGNNAEPVRDARALERVLQHASQGTPDNYARINPILYTPGSPSSLVGAASPSSYSSPPQTSLSSIPAPSSSPTMFATNANANGLSMPGPSSSSSYPFGLSGLAAAPGEVAALTGAFEGLGGFGRSATPPSPAVHYHVASMSAAERPQGLGTDVSDESVEKMRRWFSRMIFQPLAAAIKDVDSALEAEGLAHLTTRASFLAYPAMELLAVVNVAKGGLKELSPSAPAPQQPQPTGLFGMKPATTAFGGFGTGFGQPAAAAQPVKPATLGALLQARPHDPMVRKRLLLEMYLTLPPVADMYARFPRDYVVARITELAQGGMLAAYRWDGGGSFAGEAWSRTRPTDAELVMHCFLTFMDIQIQMAGIAVSNLTPFTSRYYVSQDSKPDPTRTIQIRQFSRIPPHYGLVLRGSIPVDLPGKRQNVFGTLALFVSQVFAESAGVLSGYSAPLYLGAPGIELFP